MENEIEVPEMLSEEFNKAWSDAMDHAFEQINGITLEEKKEIEERF
jgi:hypothetical protein